MLTPYEWVYGIAVLTTVFLSVVAGFIALSLFEHARQRKYLAAWRPLCVGLVLFAVLEIFGALKIFNIWSTPWLTHVLASFILVFVIAALLKQINITRGFD